MGSPAIGEQLNGAAAQPPRDRQIPSGELHAAVAPPPAAATEKERRPNGSPEVEWKAGKQELSILGTMALLNVILALDATVLVPALPTLSRELGGSAIEAFWAGTSYLLANTVFLPFLGAISDVFGRQPVLFLSLVMFTAGTIICCTAQGFTQLLAGRAVQGFGGGGLFSLSFIITTDIIPLRQRPKYQSMIMASFALGTILGPLTGGLVAELAQWQWLFYINFPFCAIGLVAVPWAFRRLKPKTRYTFIEGLQRIDWIGGGLFMAGTSVFLMGLTWGGVQYPWSSFKTWLPILLGACTTAAAIVYELFVPEMPLLRLSIFNTRSGALIFLLTGFFGFELYTHLYYLPFYLVSVKALRPSITGVYIMALSIIMIPLGVVTGATITRRGTYLWAIRLGFAALAFENGLLLYLDQDKSLVAHFFVIITVAVGHGFLMVSLNIATQAIATTRDVVFAVSMFTFIRQFGICVGVGVGGTIFNNVMLHALEGRGIPGDTARAIAENSEAFVAILTGMDDGPQKTALTSSYVDGFRGIWYLLLALAAISLALSFLVKHHSIDKIWEPTYEQRAEPSSSDRAPDVEAG